MKYNTVKFKFNTDNGNLIDNAFKKAKYLLNFQFDKDSNVFFIDTNVEYQIEDISNLNSEDIEVITDSFFDFTFNNTKNVFLYKFLVLKNNDKFTILSIIHPLIFNYASINDFYELFNNINSSSTYNYLNPYYDDIKKYMSSVDYDNDFDYWRKIKSDAIDYVKFYNLKSNNYKCHKIEIDNESVLNFINDHDSSIFDFYASVFSLYLSRINRQDGCLLKTSIPSKGADLKTILKIDQNGNSIFTEYLNQFNFIYNEAFSHTKISIENFIDENLSYYSIYDFSNLDKNICIYNGEDCALTLNIYDDYLEIVYNAYLFSDIYIQHMADNIKSMINDVVEFPNHLLKDVNILSDNEKKLLSKFSKGEDADVDEDFLISRYFRRHALENPDTIAVDDGVNQVSYGELEKSSNSIANDLFENYNISLDSHVGLILPRNYHFPEMVLALNKLGAAFIPIDLIYPIKRIKHMLEISEAECIVTTKDITDKFDFNLDIIYIEDLNSDDDVSFEIMATGDNLFSIMFTSGTTGFPKGVMVSNHQLAGLYVSFKNIFYFSHGDLIGCYLSFSFIASYVIYVAFAFGGGCRIFNENEQKDILSLIKTLKENPMNSLILPPTVAISVLESNDIKLDYLVLAGAKLNELSKNKSNIQLINFYGTTEIAFGITKTYDLNDIKSNNVSIGRPITNTNAYILDKYANQMPIGVLGEICVSSEYISPGYYNNSELTQEVFVNNPYSDDENNKIMYRTGDIGFFNFDGDIEIIGREDDQMSVRGFRIESDEILNIINSIPEIENVYLDVENDTLALYYTTNAKITIDFIKEKLTYEIPEYMVPSLFMELKEIPLNMNGKIDKKRLKKMSKLNSEIDIEDEVLAGVVNAFKEVLDADLVLVGDDFVELGGNSLSAMKLQILLKEKFATNLSSNEIIELSTPVNIADAIKCFSNELEITINYDFDGLCPLSESQLNVYLDESVNSMGTAYNNPFKIDFKDNYSIDEIKNALIKLFDIFPILKARVLNDDEVSFVFDGEPEITEGSLNDMDSFVKAFEFDKNLSRFLLINNDESVILCADFHHLIFDGTSIGILLNKLSSILNGNNDDFIDNGVLRQVSFEEMLNSSYIDDAKEFFDKMLVDRDESYDLLPSVDSDDEFEFIDTFDMDEKYLKSFLQSHTITYNQFFTSVFAYALSRFTGSNKVLFNMIEDGRGHIDLSESVGMFVKTLPVLIDCENQNVDSFLEHSSNLINSVMKYNLYPFRVLANKYDLNSNILFQYSHDLFNDILNKYDIKYDIDELKHDLNADLSFYIFNNGVNKFIIRILYSSLYSKNLVENFVKSYKLILHDIIEVNELKDINYLSDVDCELLDSYNKTEHSLIYDDILDAFNDNLLDYPENELVCYNDVSYSYSEGAYIADTISQKLIDLGVETQDTVSFLVPRSELYMFCVLGIMSMGCIYVPLDENLPDERIKFMINDTKSKVLIVIDETYERGRNLDENCIILNISDIIGDEIKSLDKLNVSYGDLACILYTSGSTGLPKGVKITRKSIVNFVDYHVHDLEILRGDVYGLFASIGFDVAMAGIFSAIYSGACLNVIPDNIKLNIKLLNDYFLKYGITHSYITTQIAKVFISQIEYTSLKVLVVGGEKLGEIDEVRNYRIVDAYGPTEAYVYVISEDTLNKIDYSSVGHVQSNTKAYILDKEFRQVPIGAIGELYLSGCQLADGYLNRPEETQKAFSNNPFENNDEYGKLYCTGDVARILPDGTYGIIGRRDSQIKVRGNRLELTEVEASIREMDIIDDVTVQITNINENNELIAYVISDESDEEHLKDLICDYVGKVKPEYMIPSFIMKLESIPLNINGKVDKRALPEIDLTSLREEYVAPRNSTEHDIVDAFEKVFNQNKISIYDDFTRLGGDSLTAVKLLSIIKDYNVSVADILSLRTHYAIAKNINKSNIQFDSNIYSLDSGCPLNESQLNVYLDIMANDKKDSYLIPLQMDISDENNVNNIKDALDVILEVHPILGMCVSDDFDVPYLVKGSKPSIIVESDVSDDFISNFLVKSFNLNDSLCRFLIVENDRDFSLFAVFHHIIFDALSEGIFKQDLQSILKSETVDLDDSFLKVSAFTQQIAQSNDFSEAKEFYELMLVDSDDTGELLDSVHSDGPSSLSIDLYLDYDILNSFLEKHNVNENILFCSAFAYTLSRFTGSEKALFNIVENGRDRFSNYNSIGMFVNTLPLLVECKNQNIDSFMNYMFDRVYSVMRYNYYPFRLLANKYDINSNILFQFIPEWIKETRNLDDDAYVNDLLSNMNDLIADLTVEIIQNGNDYILSVMYSDRYSCDFISHFAESYKMILKGMLNEEKLGDINYISSLDLILLDEINDTEHDLEYIDVLDAFNDNLSKYPDNKLVLFNDTSYTYSECAFIASRIAESLIDSGVEMQDRVGFLVPRSELYMLSVLGVLSSGCIYIPLDDDLPDERIEFILKDSNCKVVIVSRETKKRLSNLNCNCSILNISNIICDNIGSLSHLPTRYGDLACMLYTSGTTGIPKGVKITRKSIVNVVESYVDNYGLTDNDVYALFSAISFDVSSFVICAVLYSGSCLSVIPEDIRFSMTEMNRYFIKHNVSHAFITTQVAKLFMQNVDDISLDVLLVASEKLGDVEYSGYYELVDGFGPTEAFAFMSSIPNSQKINSTSVGHLNYNMKAYVLDNEARRVPYGAVGELCLAGYQVADGYLNREEETKNAFTINPFEDNHDYGILYHTGDMVRLLPDASLGLVGRRDSQVKIRGNRVELGEVETVIRELDYILDVSVQTVKIKDNYELVAYVVSDECNEDLIRNKIREYVREVKPDYMVLSFVICLDNIPLTVNGKVDRRSLPEVNIASLSVEYTAPTNETEEQIVHAFEVVFNQKNIGLNDDFIHLGGDSITAIRLISLLEKNDISCSAKDILNYKTPYLIAQNAKKISKKSYDSTTGKVDLLPIQSYFFDEINSNEFSQEFILKSKENLDLDTLQSAFDELTNVHDMLRATYKYDNNNIIQEILPLDSQVCEIKEYVTDDLEKTVKNIINESKKSLDISSDLIKICLIQYENESYVVFVIHHLIIDGVSWSILIDDLTYIINRIKNNREINLLRPYPYKNWVGDVKSLVKNISDDEKEKWISINNQLDDSLIKGKSKGFILSIDAGFDVDNLLMISEEEYLALSIARAYKKTYNRNIIFNRESYGRDESLADVSRTVGWFTSQYPVIVDTNNNYNTVSLMRDVYNIKEAFKGNVHLGLNYESLIYTVHELEYHHCPVTFNFLSEEFSFENELFKSVNLELSINEKLEFFDLDHVTFGVSLNVSRLDNHYVINGEYADSTYLADKFSEFIENIKHELEHIADYDSAVVSCCLSESQLGIYLDEKVHEMGTAYSTLGILQCPEDKTVGEIENAIHQLIDKHPILMGRVVDGDVPLLVCDTYPSIKTSTTDDYSKLIKPFDLNESLARFNIIENNNGKFVFYDIHHIISDATSCTILNNDLSQALEGLLDGSTDLGFVHAGNDSFDLQFESRDCPILDF